MVKENQQNALYETTDMRCRLAVTCNSSLFVQRSSPHLNMGWPTPHETINMGWPTPHETINMGWPTPHETINMGWPTPHETINMGWNMGWPPPTSRVTISMEWPTPHVTINTGWPTPHETTWDVLTSCNNMGGPTPHERNHMGGPTPHETISMGWPTPHGTTCDVLTSCNNMGWPACDNQHGKAYTSRTINKRWTSFWPRPYSVSNQQNAPHERNNLRRIIRKCVITDTLHAAPVRFTADVLFLTLFMVHQLDLQLMYFYWHCSWCPSQIYRGCTFTDTVHGAPVRFTEDVLLLTLFRVHRQIYSWSTITDTFHGLPAKCVQWNTLLVIVKDQNYGWSRRREENIYWPSYSGQSFSVLYSQTHTARNEHSA